MSKEETAVQYTAPPKGDKMFSWKVVFQHGEIKRVPEDITRALVIELMRVFPGKFAWVPRPVKAETKSYNATGNKQMKAESDK
jgi:hypothetical protein